MANPHWIKEVSHPECIVLGGENDEVTYGGGTKYTKTILKSSDVDVTTFRTGRHKRTNFCTTTED